MKRHLVSIAILLFCAFGAAAQTTVTIRGTVTSQVNGLPLHGVTVQIRELRRSVVTDNRGEYELAGLAPGRYTVLAHIEGFSDQAQTVDTAGGGATADFSLALTAINEEVTVTASGTEESVFESFQTVNSIGSTRIREQASTAIGEVLEREAGVSKRSFGPGTSRPVIRGFDGDRVLVLQDGVRNGSLGSQSGDHGEPVDTMSLERLEVIKGPATLLYGSNALGGVVNAVSTDENTAHRGVRGYFTALGATNNRQGGVSGGAEYGLNNFVFKGNANFLREGDYRTPLGRIPNSSSRAHGGNFSIGYFGEKAFVNGYFGADRRRYGVPYAPLFEEGVLLSNSEGGPCEPDEETEGGGAECEYDVSAIQQRFALRLPEVPDEEIDLRMRRNNYRFRAGWRNLKSPIPQANFYIDFTDYEHQEIETAEGVDEIATNFFNDVFTYRGVFQQANFGKLTGRFGFEGFRRSYLTEGAEQLVEGRIRQHNFSVFGLEELDLGRVALQFGGRVENNRYLPANAALYDDRSFTGFSGAVGVRIGLWDGASFVTNFTSSYRAPALEELYNFGPHIGTVTFEIGDQDLTRERSNGIEFSLRQRVKHIRINGSVFFYNIDNFIFISPQDADGDGRVDVEDNLPVGAYTQDDARFVGADLSVDVDIHKNVGIFFAGDIVRARISESDLPLPRITPPRVRLGADLRYKGLSVRPEAVFVGEKEAGNIFTLETPTAGYRLFNVNASYTFATGHTAHIFSFSGNNLGDRLYRNHLSYIKDLAPEPGRGFRFSYTLRFF